MAAAAAKKEADQEVLWARERVERDQQPRARDSHNVPAHACAHSVRARAHTHTRSRAGGGGRAGCCARSGDCTLSQYRTPHSARVGPTGVSTGHRAGKVYEGTRRKVGQYVRVAR
eukprot:3796082-Rhodomonas_salina.3